jgi:hypothetical protein
MPYITVSSLASSTGSSVCVTCELPVLLLRSLQTLQDVGLRPLACWNCGFQSRRVHEYLSLVSAVCCQVEVSASVWSLVPRSPTKCGVSEYENESSIMRTSWPTIGCCAMVKKKPSKACLVRYFLYNMNKFGDRELPCLTPLALFTLLVLPWVTVHYHFHRLDNDHFPRQFLNVWSKPNFSFAYRKLPSCRAMLYYRLRSVTLNSSSSSTGTTAHCGLWPVEQYPSIFSYLSPTLSIIVKFIQIFLHSTFVTISILLCGVVSPKPNPQPGGSGYPFLSASSPLTCLAWEALPVAYATASIALGIMWPHKPHHYVKVLIPSGGRGVTLNYCDEIFYSVFHLILSSTTI